ncbi:regulating synaptic membrane exocytosis protein 2-like [Ctenocephalides felis]|uniref:regulating synaptic membrane exocytosis protein 2-like n=1 Tax=Ctenocephalides felis TaxID=7515 RepID=UPI000E6E4E2A|nr:regulating synaptic membrane exocytosis protein 2-like [Ctenocephalides felis]
MADLPDLSHLTAEERAIIENVMMRQKEEEEREKEIMRRKQDEVAVLEDTIRQRSEQQKKAGIELDATCHICLKTKFADGVGHVCHYCNIRCCARCGGKVTLRSSKVIWVCILCRKKQELLSKTGQWINKGPGQDAIMRRIEADMQHQIGSPAAVPAFHHQQTLVQPGHQVPHQQFLQQQSCDKRPKLERARSAAEQEMLNAPSSPLRRQYSQQEQRLIPPDDVDDPSYYRGELEGLMRTHPHLVHPRQRFGLTPQTQQQPGVPTGGISLPETPKKHRRSRPETPTMQGQHQLQQPQISFSSSEEDLRSTPECDERLREKGIFDLFI